MQYRLAFSALFLAFVMLWLPLGQHEFLFEHWMKVGSFMAPFLILVAVTCGQSIRFKDPSSIALIMLIAYIGHQFEEHWIDLYGREFAFQSSVNQLLGDALGANVQDGVAPEILTRASVFVINTSLVWLVGALAIWRSKTAIFPVLAMIAIAFVNAISHVASAFLAGSYNPGLATSVFVFLPLGVWFYTVMWRGGLASVNLIWWSIAWSVAAHVIMILGVIVANWWQLIPEYVFFCILVFWAAFPTILSVLRSKAHMSLLAGLICVMGWPLDAQNIDAVTFSTESPRDTVFQLDYFAERIETRLNAYEETRGRADYVGLRVLIDSTADLFDLSDVPVAIRSHVGEQSVARVLDILATGKAINVAEIPSLADIPQEGAYSYQIEGTILRLRRVEERDRKGEVLFDRRTVERILQTGLLGSAELAVGAAHEGRFTKSFAQLTGPTIPAWLPAAFEATAGTRLFDTPSWKVYLASVVLIVMLAVLWFLHRAIGRVSAETEHFKTLLSLLRPLSVLITSLALSWFLNVELHLSGRLAIFVQAANTANLHIAAAWASWIVVRAFFEGIATRKNAKPDSIDVNMLRLIGRITAAVSFVTILTLGAQALGFPILSILAGFGLGGLAIALAIRPTFENLIGGLILYLDRPIKVGDFCTFGSLSGSVERIGVRSTQIRALDRTLITVPNAQFADLHLVNWAACDMMQVTSTLGFRYETDMDTLRDVLADIRKMLHSHPKVDQDTVRVRFAGFGDYALNVDLRVCIVTREWNEFFAIREDVFLRVGEIVADSGTDFAFPSQTLYLQRGEGLEEGKMKNAQERVDQLKRRRLLPFPRFAEAEMARFAGTLDYPPKGSPDFLNNEEELMQGSETLSSDPPEKAERSQ